MKDSNKEKIPTKIYVIVSECFNLPDLRTEKEKKRGKKSSWQVIFPDAKENLSTGLKEDSPNVSWMCECFLTLKSINNSFSMVVLDEHSRKAGTASIKLTDIPEGDNQLIKPGRQHEGARDAYRNLYPVQTHTINSSKSVLSFWIWALEFREASKFDTNLGRLKAISKSASNLFKEPAQGYMSKTKKVNKILDLNPFRGMKDEVILPQSTNPFEDCSTDFLNTFGKSSFETIEHPGFRPSVWIPKERELENRTSMLPRCSSLPGMTDFVKNLNFQDYATNQEQQLSFAVSESDLTNFNTLSDIYKDIQKELNNADILQVKGEEFFSILNNIQRRFAINIIKIKTLDEQNKNLNDQVTDLRTQLYQLKNILVNNNLSDMMFQI